MHQIVLPLVPLLVPLLGEQKQLAQQVALLLVRQVQELELQVQQV
jgi:hypothetical protein